ncbi:hypothetical protein M3Y94_00820900 [Aphelenchoides besseyi]|nr:hypothetical protein M3Y94_00820900 [Aphelenchoides besseyi]KAI6227116.1 hypothetical protein M3Y95_00692700 [Aphelenchoides besseyi]
MCSCIGQIFYGAVMLCALALTLACSFTPEWRKVTDTTSGQPDGSAGLFNFNCKLSNTEDCAQLFNARPTWEKIVIIALIVTMVLEALAVIWTVFTFFACCCNKRAILHPFSGFALFSAIGLIVALSIFYTHFKDQIDSQSWEVTNVSQLRGKSNLGYSFFLGCAALVANIIAIVIGGLTSCLTSHK